MKKTAASKTAETPASEKAPKKAKAVAKVATAKKPVAKTAKVAAPKAAKKTAGATATPTSRALTAPATVVVRFDAGWGNALHLRGEGPGLSWDTGAPMCCVNGTEWVWVAPAAGTVVFKVLHNDHAWALGENLVVAAGDTATVTPVF